MRFGASARRTEDTDMEFILGIIVFFADIWAIVNILRAPGTSTLAKLLWILLILFLPVVGLIIWLVAGPRASKIKGI
jgi:hypothetical protein